MDGEYKDSWRPKSNITSDIIEDFKETANKHLAKV